MDENPSLKRMIREKTDSIIKQIDHTNKMIGMNTDKHEKEILKSIRKAKWNYIKKMLLEGMKHHNKQFC